MIFYIIMARIAIFILTGATVVRQLDILHYKAPTKRVDQLRKLLLILTIILLWFSIIHGTQEIVFAGTQHLTFDLLLYQWLSATKDLTTATIIWLIYKERN